MFKSAAKIFPIGTAFLAILFALGISRSALADEQVYSNFNFAVTIPDGWVVMTNMLAQKDVRAAFNQRDKQRILLFLVDTDHTVAQLDSFFIFGYERGVTKVGGSKPISTRTYEASGTKVYERYSEKITSGKHVSNLTRVMVADGHIYIIEGLKMNGKANEDSEIVAAEDSFRFLVAPAPAGQSMVSKVALIVGGGMTFLVVLAVVLGLILANRQKSG